MCVAAVIRKSVSLEDLKRMENQNPHGAGVAWLDPEERVIRFHRGLKAHEIFRMQEEGHVTFPYLLHFRWATIGNHSVGNMHPFPTGAQTLLGEPEGSAQSVLMHNGTWNQYGKYLRRAWEDGIEIPEQELLDAMSDTAIAAWLCGTYPELLDGVGWATAMGFVDEEDGEPVLQIQLRGTTWTTHEGNEFSNLNWRPYEYDAASFQTRRKFWKEYAARKGWTWLGDEEADTVASPAVEIEDCQDWDSFLESKYPDEVIEACDLDALAELEDNAEYEPIDLDLARECCPTSEDPEVVNSWLARQMVL